MFASAALVALLAAPGAVRAASAIVQRAENKNLEEAKKLLAKGSFEPALEELKTAEGLPGNSPRQLAEIAALRASALLSLPPSPERKAQADEALVTLFHLDAASAVLPLATFTAQARAQALRAERPLLIHDRIATARLDRPLLIQARLTGSPAAAAKVVLHYRIEPTAADQSGSDEEYVALPMDLQRNGAFEAYLRPGVGGIPTGGDHVLRYYLEARASDGALLDQNGSVREPIRALLSPRDGGQQVTSALSVDEGAKRPVIELATTPWYKRWEIVGPIGGALILGAVVAVVLLQPKPQPQAGSLGKVDLP